MAEGNPDKITNLPVGGRPRSNLLVQLDLYNAYERLNGFRVEGDTEEGDAGPESQTRAAAGGKAERGVSPLMSTEEIKAIINRLRQQLTRRRRDRSEQEFGTEERKLTELQDLENEIGSARARARYDELNPQNELLTVQPSPHDRWLDPKHRAGLVTAWLVEELGRESLLPSPESLLLWAPKGVAPELAVFLSAFVPEVSDVSGVSGPDVSDAAARTGAAPARPAAGVARTVADAGTAVDRSDLPDVADLARWAAAAPAEPPATLPEEPAHG